MGKRQLITSTAFSAADRQQLATAILNYVTEAVRLEHANAHEWHHPGSPAFFDGHRQFIAKLEAALAAQGLGRFVPLPKWDPATTIPTELRGVKQLPEAVKFGPQIANPSPNLPMPSVLTNLDQFPTAAALSANQDLQNWHGNVHVTVGGAMRDVTVSPCATIFWPWHAFIDDIYEDWLHRGPERYILVMEQHTGPAWFARHGLTPQQYQQHFDESVPKGYRPVIAEGYMVNGQERYILVMEQRPEPAWFARHGLTSQQYQQHFDESVPKGYRPVIAQAYRG